MIVSHSEKIFIKASPEKVYSIISDVTKMGYFSPECYKCEWIDGATGPQEGARFLGYTRVCGGTCDCTKCEILQAKPGQVFSFHKVINKFNLNIRKYFNTVWTYRMEKVDGGTLLTESFRIGIPSLFWKIQLRKTPQRQQEIIEGMKTTLKNIKEYTEKEAEISNHEKDSVSICAP